VLVSVPKHETLRKLAEQKRNGHLVLTAALARFCSTTAAT